MWVKIAWEGPLVQTVEHERQTVVPSDIGADEAMGCNQCEPGNGRAPGGSTGWAQEGRSVHRGMARRKTMLIKELGIDETSYQKQHEYVTILIDRDRNVVLDVLDGRKKADLKAWLEAIPER